MNENIFEKATRLAAAWHAKALNIDGLAAEIDRDRDLVEALKGTTLPIATGEDFKFWEDLLFAAGYVRDQILLVLDDGRAVVEVYGRASGHLKEAGGKAIGHRTLLADDPQVVTTECGTVCFHHVADLPESVYVEGDAVFLCFTGRMPAHLYVAGDLSVDRAAANMLPTATLVGNDLYVLEILTDLGPVNLMDLGPVNLPDGLRVNGDVHLAKNSDVFFGNRTEIWGDILDGTKNPLADRSVPSTDVELLSISSEMVRHIKNGWVRGRMPRWLSKTHFEEGQAFVIDDGEFRGWGFEAWQCDGFVSASPPRVWCERLAELHRAAESTVEEVADRLDRACRFESEHSLGGIHEVLYLSDLPMELPEGFDKDDAVQKGVVMCRADGSCVVDTDDGFEATTLAELGLKPDSFANLTFKELVEVTTNNDHAAMDRLKRDYPPTGLDDAVVEYFNIVAFDPTIRRVLVEDEHGVAYGDYDRLAVHFYGDDIDPWDGADILARNIEHYVEIGGAFDGDWDGLDIVPIEGGWRITVLAGDDEGAVIEVVDGKATVLEVDTPTEDEIEQVGLSLTRPHDGGVPI